MRSLSHFTMMFWAVSNDIWTTYDVLVIDGTTLQVRGLGCLNGTPLIDLKPSAER